jgi:transcriptional regulator with XRE-family HTH domain
MKLRALRNQKHLTLYRLAAETGLSTALLSKLETDRMVPTLPTLATISRVYGIGLSYFFTEAQRHSVSITRRALLRENGRSAEQVRYIPLNCAVAGPKLLAAMVELAPGAASAVGECTSEVCAVVYVLEGQLEINTGGLEEVLDTGDCAYAETAMPASWRASGEQRCRLLIVSPARTPS